MLVNSDGTPRKRDIKYNVGDKVEPNKTTLMSARDRGRIDEIIKALEALEQDKMLCYADEIGFLKRIREW